MGDCISWCNPVFKRVETLPELDYATRNHAYILPDNKAYILNDNGDGFTELTSSTTNVYDDKPLVARVEKLEAKEDSDKQTLSLNDRTITISNGNSITLPEDRDTVYDDAELKRRIQAVESRTDNFVNGVNVSREGNKVKLTYTFVDGTSKEVEFDDKDTITLAYDDSEVKRRITSLENKPDNDKQKLSYSNGVLSIENGNSVTVPMSIGKSAYQSWLDTGNTGTEQDFIRSLKGAKGDKGDVTDIGTSALLIYYCDLTSNIVHITGGYNAYKALTYNTKTQLGTVHLDLTPNENSPEAHIIGKLPKDAPKPYSLVEVSVFGNRSDGTGQIYITPEGIIRCNALTKGRRYIVDLLGYYVYK